MKPKHWFRLASFGLFVMFIVLPCLYFYGHFPLRDKFFPYIEIALISGSVMFFQIDFEETESVPGRTASDLISLSVSRMINDWCRILSGVFFLLFTSFPALYYFGHFPFPDKYFSSIEIAFIIGSVFFFQIDFKEMESAPGEEDSASTSVSVVTYLFQTIGFIFILMFVALPCLYIFGKLPFPEEFFGPIEVALILGSVLLRHMKLGPKP